MPMIDISITGSGQHSPGGLQAQLGSQVHVRPGGSFVLQPEHASGPLLFVAGGIGITPLMSMLSHAHELCQGASRLSVLVDTLSISLHLMPCAHVLLSNYQQVANVHFTGWPVILCSQCMH